LVLNQSGPMKNETSWMVVMPPFLMSGLREYCVWMTCAPSLRAAAGKEIKLQSRELLAGIVIHSKAESHGISGFGVEEKRTTLASNWSRDRP